jgi:hypothetical protein
VKEGRFIDFYKIEKLLGQGTSQLPIDYLYFRWFGRSETLHSQNNRRSEGSQVFEEREHDGQSQTMV